MKTLRAILLAMTLGLCASTSSLAAQEFDMGGSGYQNSWTAPSLTPYIALGTVAAVAIAVMAIRHHHGHGHSH